MNAIYISGEIDEPLVKYFFEEFNRIRKDVPIYIYLNSDGGDVNAALAIIDLINENYKRITLIASGHIYSAAFHIFFYTQCKKRIVDETIGMIHFSWAAIETNEAGMPTTDEGRFLMRTMKANKHKTVESLKTIGLNRTELADIKAHKEVYFTTERLKELLDGQEN